MTSRSNKNKKISTRHGIEVVEETVVVVVLVVVIDWWDPWSYLTGLFLQDEAENGRRNWISWKLVPSLLIKLSKCFSLWCANYLQPITPWPTFSSFFSFLTDYLSVSFTSKWNHSRAVPRTGKSLAWITLNTIYNRRIETFNPN